MDIRDFLSLDSESIKKADLTLLSESVPLPTADALSEDMAFGPIIRKNSSRVIRFYRITEPVFPCNDKILESPAVVSLPFVPCNLFRPTIKALTPEQKKYFFFFCQKIEQKEKVQTSFAYILLYLCRILRKIELIDALPDTFYWLWENYRKEFPFIDKLFSDVLCDFCFYRHSSPDFSKIDHILLRNDFRSRPFLLDLYLFDHLFRPDKKLNTKEMNFILRNLTGESFRRSKAYRSNPRFAAACEEAVSRAFEKGLFTKDRLNANLFSIKIPSEVHTVRNLFAGLPEEEVVKAKINLCSVPLLHDNNIRWRCDEILRYLENRLRGIFKIKNALSRIHISTEHKAFLEDILSPYEALSQREEEEALPFFAEEKKITPREFQIDPEKASEIEASSWDITEKLTQSYLEREEDMILVGEEPVTGTEEKYKEDLEKISRPALPLSAGEFWEFAASLTENEDAYLSILLYRGKEMARRFAVSLGAFPEALTASCNQKAIDAVGDGVIDPAGDIYDDYRNDLKEVFLEPKGDILS